jgi:hypothetical protein
MSVSLTPSQIETIKTAFSDYFNAAATGTYVFGIYWDLLKNPYIF